MTDSTTRPLCSSDVNEDLVRITSLDHDEVPGERLRAGIERLRDARRS